MTKQSIETIRESAIAGGMRVSPKGIRLVTYTQVSEAGWAAGMPRNRVYVMPAPASRRPGLLGFAPKSSRMASERSLSNALPPLGLPLTGGSPGLAKLSARSVLNTCPNFDVDLHLRA